MKRQWTDEEISVVRERYANSRTDELARELGRTPNSVYQQARKMGLSKDPTFIAEQGRLNAEHEEVKRHQFKAGHRSWNKGKKGWQAGGRAKETQFKPGELQGAAKERRKPLGTEERNKDGVLIRKVRDNGTRYQKWRPVHVLLWEEHNGPAPKGHIVVFKNRNRDDIRLGNLECITRAENMRRNSHYNRYPPEVARLIQLRGALNRQINKRAEQ